MVNKDCLYYEEKEKDTGMRHCKYSGTLFKENEKMCDNCRLWDAYIPRNSTNEQIEYAKQWQDSEYDEQDDYNSYFEMK